MTDASIILGGRAPNILGALVAGTQGGQQAREFQQQNALNGYIQQNAPQIMAGNQNALSGLAGMGAAGLEAARGIEDQNLARENTRLGMDRTRQQMRILDEQQAMAVREQAAALSAQQRAAQAAAAEQAAAIVLSADNEADFNALAAQHAPEYVGQFGQRDAIAAKFLDIKDVLEMGQGSSEPAGVQALRIRAQEAGLQPNTPEYQQFMASGGVPTQSTAMRVGPDGTVEFTQGTGADSGANQRVTERQSQLQLFSGMMRETGPAIEALESQFDPSNLKDNVASRAGTFGNYAMSPEARRYRTASAAWAEGVLRIQTGAAATQPEIERVQSTYFAVPGDDANDIAQKKRLREAFLESIIGASGGAVTADEQLEQPTIDFSAMDAATILQQDLSEMSAADLAAYMARMDELGL